MTKARTDSPNGYINSLRNGFITREQRTITRLKNLAQTTITPPAYPQAEIQNSQKWALEIIRYEEGLLESIYRNLIDDKERLRKAESLADKRRQDIINSHNSAIEKYNQKITEISKALEDYPILEATLSVRTDDYVNKQLASLATSGQIRITSDRLLRAYQLGLVNGDNKLSNRQDNETYDQLRNFIKAQDGHACVICHKSNSKTELHVHHIIPLKHYGTNQHVNLVTLCLTCHKKQHTSFEITKDKPQKSVYRQQDKIFIAISIKTTGNSEADEIIEITATRFENGVSKSRFQSYVYSDCYKPEFSGLISGISKQTILSAEKPLRVFEKLTKFIGEANLVFHNANHVLGFFRHYKSIYEILSRRSITDTFKIAESRKIDLKDNKLNTLFESLKSHDYFSFYTDREDSMNIGLAFIALSKTATKKPDKQTPTVSTRPRTNPSATNLESKPISQPEETMDYAFQLYQKKQYPQAFSIYRKFAKEGNAIAQYNLGVMYANAQGVKNNDQHAVYCYQKAAEQGYAAAQYNLGWMHANGQGIEKDDHKAVFWYRKAADQGYAAAQNNLGIRYANGLGIERDDQKAVFWYQKAAEQGYAVAQYNLGARYANGQGIMKDDRQAILWYRKAAEKGHTDARTNFIKLNMHHYAEKSDDELIDFYHEALAFGDILEAFVYYKILFEHTCSRLKNEVYVADWIGHQRVFNYYLNPINYKDTIDLYHESVAFGDLETAKKRYIELEKFQKNQLRNRIKNNELQDMEGSKSFDDLLNNYFESLCFGDMESAFHDFQSIVDSKLNEIVKSGINVKSYLD